MFVVPQLWSASLQLTDICLHTSCCSLNEPIRARAATQDVPLCRRWLRGMSHLRHNVNTDTFRGSQHDLLTDRCVPSVKYPSACVADSWELMIWMDRISIPVARSIYDAWKSQQDLKAELLTHQNSLESLCFCWNFQKISMHESHPASFWSLVKFLCCKGERSQRRLSWQNRKWFFMAV